jgi:hypothetical protein
MRPIADNLLTAGPALVGGRERATGRTVFPCPDDPGFEAVALPAEGRIWSWTVQRFRPKSPPYAGPADFEPFALAYVDLGPVIVESRLTGFAFEALAVGLPCRLVTEPFGDRLGFAFAPAEPAA